MLLIYIYFLIHAKKTLTHKHRGDDEKDEKRVMGAGKKEKERKRERRNIET